MIDAWGGWNLLQSLLDLLRSIAQKHQVSIANIAIRDVLDQPTVAGAIVGARLSIREHLQDNSRVFNLRLDANDRSAIASVLAKSHNLFEEIGDCGAEDRR